MNVQRRTLCTFGLATFALAACGTSTDSDPSAKGNSGGEKKLTEFTLGSFNGEIYVLDYVADKQGFFANNGLKATFISPSAGGASANTLFLGGTLKGWPGNPATIMQDMAKGEKIKIGGWRDNWIPFGIVVPKDSDLVKLKDAPFEERMKALKGKNIGLTAIGSLVYQVLLASLQTAGMSEKDITILAVGQPDAGIAQMSGGRIDAYITYSRTDVGVFNQQIGSVEYAALTGGADSPAEIAPFSSFALPVLDKMVQSDPEVVKGYLAAQQEAYEWSKANVSAAAKIVSEQIYKGKFEDIVLDALNKLFASPQPLPNFQVNKETWDGLAALLVERGVLKESEKSSLDYNQVVLDAAKSK